MSKYNIFLILTCWCFVFLIPSCEEAPVQATEGILPINGVLSLRGSEECANCPHESDCCCGVWLQNNSNTATLRFCGTSDGTGSCSGTYAGPCYSFSGGGKVISLTSSPYRGGFCMVPGNNFWVQNTSSSTSASIYISCQEKLTNPEIIPVVLAPLEQFYFTTNGDCELNTCAH